MRVLRILILIIILILLFGASASAATLGYGARAAAMGGAYTAVADDGTASYWNPAGITQIKYLTFTPSIGLQGDYALAVKDLAAGVLADGTLMVGITSKFVGVNVFADFGGYGVGSPAAWQGMAVGLAYGVLTLGSSSGKDSAWGLNIKKVQGQISMIQYTALTDTTTTVSGTIDGLTYDLGFLSQINDSTRLGLMGRNLTGDTTLTNVKVQIDNSPETPLPDRDFALQNSYIVGVAYTPYRTALIAFDVETINDPENEANNQTRLHLGFEQTALWRTVAFRAGLFTEKDKPLGVSAGIGFKLGPVLIDGAASKVGNDAILYLVTAGFKF